MAQYTSRGVTATSDGLTTGLIRADDFVPGHTVTVTSDSSSYIITLPAVADVPAGAILNGWVGTNGCEMRTVASSDTKINGGDADSNEAAIPATTWFEVLYVDSTTGYVLRMTDEGGDDIAGVTPD